MVEEKSEKQELIELLQNTIKKIRDSNEEVVKKKSIQIDQRDWLLY